MIVVGNFGYCNDYFCEICLWDKVLIELEINDYLYFLMDFVILYFILYLLLSKEMEIKDLKVFVGMENVIMKVCIEYVENVKFLVDELVIVN